MAETDSMTGLELGIMAAYASLPNFLSVEHEIGHGLYIISSGVKFWPGNHEPITQEVIANYQAGVVVEALQGIVLHERFARSQNKALMPNPILKETVNKIDRLFTDGVNRRDISFGRSIVREWERILYGDDYDEFSPKLVHKLGAYVVKRAPHLEEAIEPRTSKFCEVYESRGTVKGEGVEISPEFFKKLEQVDMSQVAPEYIEVKDDKLVEPSVWNLGNMVAAAGVESFEYDFPYYSTFEPENSRQILASVLEDLVQLKSVQC